MDEKPYRECWDCRVRVFLPEPTDCPVCHGPLIPEQKGPGGLRTSDAVCESKYNFGGSLRHLEGITDRESYIFHSGFVRGKIYQLAYLNVIDDGKRQEWAEVIERLDAKFSFDPLAVSEKPA